MVRFVASIFFVFALFSSVRAQVPQEDPTSTYGSFEHEAPYIAWEDAARDQTVQEKVQKMVVSFSDDDLAGAVLMPSFETGMSTKTFARMLCDIHARSYILLRKDTSASLTQSIQKEYAKACPTTKVALMAALDAEPSLMKFRMPKVKVADTSTLTHETNPVVAKKIAEALRQSGIFFNFAPVYDSPSFSDKGLFMKGRMYSEVTDSSSQKADTFASIMWQAGIIPTAKHFPNHGAVVGDSHKVSVTLDGSIGVLPLGVNHFMSAIGHGLPVVMIGHIIVKGGEWDTHGLPSTLSSRIMKDLLRDKLAFHGLVVTDSMAMGAVAQYPNRVVDSLKAGADLVLIPAKPRNAFKQIQDEIKQNHAFKDRLKDAVTRAQLLYAVRELQL